MSCRDHPGTNVCTTLLQYYRSSLSFINSTDLRGRGLCLWSVLNYGPTCVCKRNMTRVPFGERRARPTDRLGCDTNATGVLYTPYMCTTVFLRLCSMAQSMDTKLVYYILFKSRGRGFSCAVGGAVPPSRFDRDARRRGSRLLQT